MKKNIPNVTRKKTVDDRDEPLKAKSPVSLRKILQCGYGYSQLSAALSGGIAVAPAVAVALTLFKVCVMVLSLGMCRVHCGLFLTLIFSSFQMGADGVAPQYGSFALLGIFYLTDFQLVRFIPKPAFSCLLVLAFLDMVSTWLIGSYR